MTMQPTSIEAEALANHNSNREAVLDYIMDCGDEGATDEEMQLGIPMTGNSQRPARLWLEKHDYVTWTSGIRLTKANRKAIVWKWTGKEMGDEVEE